MLQKTRINQSAIIEDAPKNYKISKKKVIHHQEEKEKNLLIYYYLYKHHASIIKKKKNIFLQMKNTSLVILKPVKL